MPYIPHTPEDVTSMLTAIGVNRIEDLFDEIPQQLRCDSLEGIPSQLTELEVTKLMRRRAHQDHPMINFAGAGAYEHHIPAAVWELATRGEFYSAYTPYQAEASQGTLQLLYEYQTMMANLTALSASNASLYDGASALAEAILMAVRLTKTKAKQILMPTTVHPVYRRVVQAIVKNQGISLTELPYQPKLGIVSPDDLSQVSLTNTAALVIPQPNFFGRLEEVDQLTDWAHQHNLFVIALVNPLAVALLSPPGEWGQQGADIACGEGQPLGIPLSSGGPYFGFLTCQKDYIRQMPGRLVGRTVDLEGKTGYTLTLQAREQHIRRSKATSNICTNQGLMVVAATLHLALLGAKGLQSMATTCHTNLMTLLDKLTHIPGVTRVFEGPCFHETVLRFNQPVDHILQDLATQNILAGYHLTEFYPELGESLLVCTTEMRTVTEMESYAENLRSIMASA